MSYTRDQLISLCHRAFVPEVQWRNRDSAAAQRQVGECYALLIAGCLYTVTDETDDRTIWVDVHFDGFGHFDWGGPQDDETFYLPTAERLDDARNGRDWY